MTQRIAERGLDYEVDGGDMLRIKSQADVFRIPPGTRLTVRWPFNGKVAGRTYLRKQGTSAVFATPEGRDTFLNLKGATVSQTERGFNVSWPGDPGATACEYTFTTEDT